jgi:hypothetical protein
MPLKRSIPWIVGLTLILARMPNAMLSQKHQEKGFVLNSPVGENTAVRFFYDPPLSDYFHFPLVFRAVEKSSPLLNTAPMTAEGRTAYISLVEMQQLMQVLAHSNLAWHESEEVEILGSFKRLQISDGMAVLVVSPMGTAKSQIRPTKICETLKPMDSAIESQHALWEIQAFRLNYGCQVQGFNRDAYPDHY